MTNLVGTTKKKGGHLGWHSTLSPSLSVTFEEALVDGLAPDGGLYMPDRIPVLAEAEIKALKGKTLVEIGLDIAQRFIQNEIPKSALADIIHNAFHFDTPLHSLNERTSVLELFHGPTLAFKDVGARFMASTLNYYAQLRGKSYTVLVATSGDTGAAVASGFAGKKGIKVVILYPEGRVSPIQEKQLTTYGGNVSALKIQGSFDDCQRLVKQAFSDASLKTTISLTSANSINVARLLPQSFYYFRAHAQLNRPLPHLFTVPSGNFGNLTAGILAKKMGLPIALLIAATNANDPVPQYLKDGIYKPQQSKKTISNAMDVGSPSNFDRITALYPSGRTAMAADIAAISISDSETIGTIKQIRTKYNYLLDPHTAVGVAATEQFRRDHPTTLKNAHHIVLATAHPAKFGEVLDIECGISVPPTPQLSALLSKVSHATSLSTSYEDFRSWLLANAK